MVNIEVVWLSDWLTDPLLVIMYSITAAGLAQLAFWRQAPTMWTTASTSLSRPPSQSSSSSLSVSATGKRQQLTVGSDKYTQLINHYRSSPHFPSKNGTNIDLPKNYKLQKRPPSSPRTGNLSDSALWQSAPGNPSICAAPITTVTVTRHVSRTLTLCCNM